MKKSSDILTITTKAVFIVTISYFTYLLLSKPAAGHPGLVLNDKVAHFIGFFMLAFVVEIAFPKVAMLWKIMLLSAYGLLTECLQYFLPYRQFSLLDWAADISGILAFQLFVKMLHRVMYMLIKQNNEA